MTAVIHNILCRYNSLTQVSLAQIFHWHKKNKHYEKQFKQAEV